MTGGLTTDSYGLVVWFQFDDGIRLTLRPAYTVLRTIRGFVRCTFSLNGQTLFEVIEGKVTTCVNMSQPQAGEYLKTAYLAVPSLSLIHYDRDIVQWTLSDLSITKLLDNNLQWNLSS